MEIKSYTVKGKDGDCFQIDVQSFFKFENHKSRVGFRFKSLSMIHDFVVAPQRK